MLLLAPQHVLQVYIAYVVYKIEYIAHGMCHEPLNRWKNAGKDRSCNSTTTTAISRLGDEPGNAAAMPDRVPLRAVERQYVSCQ